MRDVVFLTVFLGLVAGRQPVEVAVTGEVSRVEFVLDQRVVAIVRAPPWRANIDFGASPLPRRLEARAYGNDVKVATQKINITAPPRDLRIIADGKTARVVWSSVVTAKPDRLEARLDGETVRVSRDLTIPLPVSSPFARATTSSRCARPSFGASQMQRPRAVVVILGSAYRDASQMRPAGTDAYLRRLGVPLYVWSLVEPPELPAAAKAWSGIVDVSSRAKLDAAIRDLRDDLDSQRVLWVAGDFLPSEIFIESDAVQTLAGGQ